MWRASASETGHRLRDEGMLCVNCREGYYRYCGRISVTWTRCEGNGMESQKLSLFPRITSAAQLAAVGVICRPRKKGGSLKEGPKTQEGREKSGG